ncbi:LysR family substrate-binding domain-containing protein [Nocardioides rubriscoriae]|uniref:LysR family substrate-binding domain-containing protein n=1 Tax=Nocardioides rubriscoriae TaxID=642762 RepID=UPI0011DF56B3|nr:LysR family substrate-binding domain-containing protein [Nocardioides rubriscoriae]
MTLRLGFVVGATPDRWARAWRERSREPIELVPLTEAEQVDGVRDGELDMALVRLPVGSVGDVLHCVRLYDEVPVVVAGHEHLVAAADPEGVSLADLADEQLVLPHPSGWTPAAAQLDWPPMTPAEAVETVAAGTGIAILPMSVARLHARKDVVSRPVTDLEPTTVALVWRIDRDSERTQAFVGVVKGRSANSSRG